MLQLRELGITLNKDEYLQDMANGVSAWQRAVAAGRSTAEIAKNKTLRDRQYQKLLQNRNLEIKGVETILEQLSEHYSMAIVTTSKRQDFELIHRETNICAHMSFILTKGDYPRSKPHPDPYLTATARFGVPKEEIVIIEDSERGLKSAIAAGIDCIVVKNDFVVGQNLSAANHQIESLAMLPALLRKM